MSEKVSVSGRLICENADEAAIVEEHFPEHIRLTREEPGCEMFEVEQSDDPMVWTVRERFSSSEAFKAHQTRTKSSEWGRVSAGIKRDFKVDRV